MIDIPFELEKLLQNAASVKVHLDRVRVVSPMGNER
jgi:hypothetical protein